MEDCRLSEILGRAFAYGEVDELALHLAENCSYESQYANRKFQGAEPILDNMKKVHANLNAACSYSFEIVELMSVFQSGISMESLEGDGSLRVCKHGLLLYQYNSKSPVALVICSVDDCICRLD